MSIRKKIMISLITILLLMTAGAYGYGVYYFTEHFLPGSIVNGFNCSYMDVKEAEDLLTRKIGAYVLTVNTMNRGQESITAEQAGLTYQSDGSVKKLMENQNRFLWFTAFNQHQEYEIPSSIQYDEEKTKSAIAALNCMQADNITEPSDAYIEEKDEQFVIVPEVEGNAPDAEKTKQVIIQALLTGKTVVDLEADDCYKKPSVYQNDEMLVKNCEQANKLTDVVVTYDFDDRTETVDRDVIKGWLTKNDAGDYVLDQNQMASYISGLAATYDTVGMDRTFSTYDGRGISIMGGTYGWKIDQAAEAAQLSQEIQSGTQTTREPVYSQTANSYGVNDLGDTYIEVDLSEQHMYYYQNGSDIFESDFVSGNMSYADRQTHAGIFTLYYKKSPDVLRGTMKADGTYEYESEVQYWMPFDGGIGFHDASWRDEFGGDIYLTGGSHGCINLPPDNAAVLYDIIQYGVPIVCFY